MEGLDVVLTPPYDVISPKKQKKYYKWSDYNIIRVDYNIAEDGGDKYRQAAETLEKWIAESILVKESRPAIYVLEEYFLDWEGYRRVRRGFIALIKAEKFGEGAVYPHERTFPKHKKDRLALTRATGSWFNPVFSIFPDEENEVSEILRQATEKDFPDENFRSPDGVRHSLWTLTDEKMIKRLVSAMADKDVFIADGHHRYETALNFAAEMDEKYAAQGEESLNTENRDSDHHYTLMYFVSMNDPGLSVLSAHRMLKNIPDFSERLVLDRLSENFEMESRDRSSALHMLGEVGEDKHLLVAQIGHDFYVMRPRPEALANNPGINALHDSLKELDVSICEELAVKPLIGGDANLLDHIGFEVEPVKVMNGIKTGEYQLALYLPPTPVKRMTNVAGSHQVMPHKSTYFYPKLLTGLVIYRISDNNKG